MIDVNILMYVLMDLLNKFNLMCGTLRGDL